MIRERIIFIFSIGLITIAHSDLFCQMDSILRIKPLDILAFEESNYDCGEIAKKDIQIDSVKLYLIGGLSPIIYDDQYQFEERFGIKYYDNGCDASFMKCMTQYNLIVFDELDKKFGKSWRRQVRKDVLGFMEWRKRQG